MKWARLFLLVAISGSFKQAYAEGTKAPNILLILTDDQRWDTVAALGNSEIQTPNMDRLVGRGFTFANAYCMGSMVPAVCRPSRTMFITGRSLWKIPENPQDPKPRPDIPVLPTLLSEAGYVTVHSGKAGNTCTFANNAFSINHALQDRTETSATEHADFVIDFLRTHDLDTPFFVYLAPPVPHDPRVAPKRFMEMYDPATLSLSANFMPQHPFDNGELKIRDELLAPHPRTPDVMKTHLAEYYATITHMDFEIGRILKTLEDRGMADNTIILFTSDQGLAVGGRHGLMGKQHLYEHNKPPLVIAGPGIPKGKSDALVYLFDLFPTICELAGVATPSVAEGKSLLPVVRGEVSKVREELFCAYRDCQRMIRDDRWKLIEYHVGGARNTQLFDLSKDPQELVNLAGESSVEGIRMRLAARLEQSRAHYGDPVSASFSERQ